MGLDTGWEVSDDFEAGFTLLELMICLAIVAILTMLALPNYHHYLRRAYYLELVQAAMPYKLGVSGCFQEQGDLQLCRGGNADVPPDRQDVSDSIVSISTNEGRIHVVPRAVHGIDSADDYWLIPEIQDGQLRWHPEGGGVAQGYVR